MVILEDTRQKAGKHSMKQQWFAENGIEIRRTKLYVGDYQIANSGSRAVDTKENVIELMGDMNKQHERFRDELIRAQEAGIRLMILVEEYPPGGDILAWKSPRWKFGKKRGLPITMAKPSVLKKQMDTMTEKYGTIFRFCRPEDAGSEIMKFLEGEE